PLVDAEPDQVRQRQVGRGTDRDQGRGDEQLRSVRAGQRRKQSPGAAAHEAGDIGGVFVDVLRRDSAPAIGGGDAAQAVWALEDSYSCDRSSRYSSLDFSSSVWAPAATTRPPSMSATRSARGSVDGRWTTSSPVTPSSTRASDSSITASVWTSTDDSGSSSTSTGGLPRTARASASRCRCPP